MSNNKALTLSEYLMAMSKQQLLNNAVKVLAQDSVAVQYNRCVFRDDDGQHCAIGQSIPDSMYSYEDIEGLPVSCIVCCDFGDSAAMIHRHFMCQLQDVHDSAVMDNMDKPADVRVVVMMADMYHNLTKLAQAYNLTI